MIQRLEPFVDSTDKSVPNIYVQAETSSGQPIVLPDYLVASQATNGSASGSSAKLVTASLADLASLQSAARIGQA